MIERNRRSPESILKAIKEEVQLENKGTLRVFLGMCPGVGKTYAMLEAAQELIQNKQTVIVGIVETHGRKETEQLLDGLNILPLVKINYRGVTIKEMDLDAILKLDPKPDVVIVDELAHHNAVGSRHNKRYQDVQELIAHDFNVFTTVNIQHIESRNDQVAQITGVVVKETVPDSFFDNADVVEIIDISSKNLLKRLNEGKVYLGERANRAKENFFQEDKLTALRELALRFTAEFVDKTLKHQRELKGIEDSWNVNEKFLVAISSNPNSSQLIRAARHLAYITDAPWIALYVDSGIKLSADDKKNLNKNKNLARELGAEVISTVNTNIFQAIINICKHRGITQIVMGMPIKSLFQKITFKKTIIDKIFQTDHKMNIHLLQTSHRENKKILPDFQSISFRFSSYLFTTIFASIFSIFFYLILPFIGYKYISTGFLLAIILLAIFNTFGPTIFSSIFFSIVWIFFFLNPKFSFQIQSWQELVIVCTFFIAALVGGFFSSRSHKQETLMAKRESRNSLIYEFNRKIGSISDMGEIIKIIINTVTNLVNSRCTVLLADNNGELNFKNINLELDDKYKAVAIWSFENKKKAGKFTNTLASTNCICYPIIERLDVLGVLVIIPNEELKELSNEDDNTISTITKQVANTIEKINLTHELSKIELLDKTKELQKIIINNLALKFIPNINKIFSISKKITAHNNNSIDQAKYSLLNIVNKLNIIFNNLLDYIKIESEDIDLQLSKFKLSKLFNGVFCNFHGDESRRIIINTEDKIEIIADFDWLSKAMLNLIDNAIQHTSGNIYVDWYQTTNEVNISLKDEGNFNKNKKIVHEKLDDSVSANEAIGLQIVTKIIYLHHGNINATNVAQDLGLDIFITLPISNTNSI